VCQPISGQKQGKQQYKSSPNKMEQQSRVHHFQLDMKQGGDRLMTRAPPTASIGFGHQQYQYHNSRSPKNTVAATVTPTSTPPIRVTSPSSNRTRQGHHHVSLSPSPLTTQAQKKYYEDSTWRMYDRIQSSRPPKHCLIPPMSSLSSAAGGRPSAMSSLPRFNQRPSSSEDSCLMMMGGCGDHEFVSSNRSGQEDDDEELIFDLEM
jgi:hypothetical protein